MDIIPIEVKKKCIELNQNMTAREVYTSYYSKHYDLSFDSFKRQLKRWKKSHKEVSNIPENKDKHDFDIIETLKKGIEIKELSEKLNISVKTCESVIEDIKSQGYNVLRLNSEVKISNIVIPTDNRIEHKWNGDKIIRFGLMGDTQINSKYTQITHLHKFYDICKSEGIDTIYHTGDIDEGEQMRPGHQYECYEQGADDHVREIVKVYPKREGIKTYFITGNHDASIIKRCGYDIGYPIANQRDDMIYLGQSDAVVNLTPNCTLELRHPIDGTAYALSYKLQKMIESMSGGEKPNILAVGHYHKAEYFFYRNVHAFQTACFLPYTLITMADGTRKRISDIKVGDYVITHNNNTKKVTEVFKRKYSGDFYKLNYGRKNRPDQTITATEEHPILVERNGKKQWVQIKNVTSNDYVFTSSKPCDCCGEPIPYFLKLCKNCNPMDNKKTREKLSETRGGFKKTRAKTSSGIKHLKKDIIPFCDDMKKDGWQIVPIGAGVIPDAVGFKDGKIVLFEVESSKNQLLEFKKAKYKDAPISSYVDDIRWIDISDERKEQPRTEYCFDKKSGLCKVKVLSVEKADKIYTNNRNGKEYKFSYKTVYNFEVEDDHSYIAGNIAVHNCFQAQTPWMKGKGIAAAIGGWIVEINVDDEGTITRIKQEYVPFYKAIHEDYKNWS